MKTIWCRPATEATSTEIVIGDAPELIGPTRSGSALLLVDQGFARFHASVVEAMSAAFFETKIHVVEGGEATKELSSIATIWDALSRHGIDRSGTLIAIGGGAVLDAASFAAATWHRGISVWLAPTTLTAQVDAALGGKSAINHRHAKNQIGLIRQPARLLIDPAWIRSVSDTEYMSGLGEVVKTGLLAGGRLHSLLVNSVALIHARDPSVLREIVELCLTYKTSIVEVDPEDRGIRASLNAGHTLGHVIESMAIQKGIPVAHGTAVALGLRLESKFLPGYDSESVRSLLDAFGFPNELPFVIGQDEAVAVLMKDKKREGRALRLPIIESPGSVSYHAIRPEQIAAAFVLGS